MVGKQFCMVPYEMYRYHITKILPNEMYLSMCFYFISFFSHSFFFPFFSLSFSCFFSFFHYPLGVTAIDDPSLPFPFILFSLSSFLFPLSLPFFFPYCFFAVLFLFLFFLLLLLDFLFFHWDELPWKRALPL